MKSARNNWILKCYGRKGGMIYRLKRPNKWKKETRAYGLNVTNPETNETYMLRISESLQRGLWTRFVHK